MSRLVLASASPRRVELLQQLGLDFEQHTSPVQEPVPSGDPAEHAAHSARVKAEAVAALLEAEAPGVPRLVIGADTVVCVDDQLLGKPRDAADARRMLGALSGRDHTVCTGIALVTAGRTQLATETTRVWMAALDEPDLDAYIGSGEPMDKAGAYGIQGLGARFIERIEGCYYNVVGLPLYRLTTLLAAAGFDLNRRILNA